jgi:hypothetical protein
MAFDEMRTVVGKWHDGEVPASGAGVVAFVLNFPVGTVVDLHYSVQLFATNGAALECAAATAGKMYYNYLDNTATSGAIGNNYLTPLNVWGSGPKNAFG